MDDPGIAPPASVDDTDQGDQELTMSSSRFVLRSALVPALRRGRATDANPEFESTHKTEKPTIGGLLELCSVAAPGIESDQRQRFDTIEQQSGMIGTDADPANVSDRAFKCAIVRGDVTELSEAYELSNVVETALAKALLLAAEGGRWDIAAKIANELEARRRERCSGRKGARAALKR